MSKAYIDQAVADATRQLDVLTHGLHNPARRLAEAAYSQLMHLGASEAAPAPEAAADPNAA